MRRSALYEAIPERHTDRSPYGARAISAGVRAQMSALQDGPPDTRPYWFSSDADRARGGALMIAAARAITQDAQQSRDGFELFRPSWDAIQNHKDGLTLDTQGLSALTTAIAKLLPASTRAGGDTFWVNQTRNTHTKTAAAYGIVAVPDAGETAIRAMLAGRARVEVSACGAIEALVWARTVDGWDQDRLAPVWVCPTTPCEG